MTCNIAFDCVHMIVLLMLTFSRLISVVRRLWVWKLPSDRPFEVSSIGSDEDGRQQLLTPRFFQHWLRDLEIGYCA